MAKRREEKQDEEKRLRGMGLLHRGGTCWSDWIVERKRRNEVSGVFGC